MMVETFAISQEGTIILSDVDSQWPKEGVSNLVNFKTGGLQLPEFVASMSTSLKVAEFGDPCPKGSIFFWGGEPQHHCSFESPADEGWDEKKNKKVKMAAV